MPHQCIIYGFDSLAQNQIALFGAGTTFRKRGVWSGSTGDRGPKCAPFRWESPRPHSKRSPFLENDERSLRKHEPKLPIRTNAVVTCVLQYHFRWNFIQHRVPLLSGSELQKFGVPFPGYPLPCSKKMLPVAGDSISLFCHVNASHRTLFCSRRSCRCSGDCYNEYQCRVRCSQTRR